MGKYRMSDCQLQVWADYSDAHGYGCGAELVQAACKSMLLVVLRYDECTSTSKDIKYPP